MTERVIVDMYRFRNKSTLKGLSLDGGLLHRFEVVAKGDEYSFGPPRTTRPHDPLGEAAEAEQAILDQGWRFDATLVIRPESAEMDWCLGKDQPITVPWTRYAHHRKGRGLDVTFAFPKGEQKEVQDQINEAVEYCSKAWPELCGVENDLHEVFANGSHEDLQFSGAYWPKEPKLHPMVFLAYCLAETDMTLISDTASDMGSEILLRIPAINNVAASWIKRCDLAARVGLISRPGSAAIPDEQDAGSACVW